jgi:hypothetical protein
VDVSLAMLWICGDDWGGLKFLVRLVKRIFIANGMLIIGMEILVELKLVVGIEC